MTFELPLRFPVLRVVQPLGEFFVCSIPANVLLKVAYVDWVEMEASDTVGYKPEGNQRRLDEDRLKAIGRYLDGVESCLPNSIILAANYDNQTGKLIEETDEFEGMKRWSVELFSDRMTGQLLIPSLDKIAAVVDGQHRLYGFEKTSIPGRQDMPLVCAVFLDLPNAYQAGLFATINFNQKQVDKSLTYELFAYSIEKEPPESWSPDKAAVFICRKLNTDAKSVFKGHISVAAQDEESLKAAAKEKGEKWIVSTATIVEGLLTLFASNPKRDRDLMLKKELGGGRERGLLSEIKPADRSPLRGYFLANRDLVIYTLVNNYFNAVSKLLWRDAASTSIQKTVGIQALFDVLKTLCVEAVAPERRDISQAFFEERMKPCAEIDFSDHFFEASGRGKQRIRKSLELCLGIRKFSDLDEDEQVDYKRVCKLK